MRNPWLMVKTDIIYVASLLSSTFISNSKLPQGIQETMQKKAFYNECLYAVGQFLVAAIAFYVKSNTDGDQR